jgi:hypothetical protein
MDFEKIYEQYCEKIYGQDYKAIERFLESLESSGGIDEMTAPYVFEILVILGRQLLEGENVRPEFCDRIKDILKKVESDKENLLHPFWTMEEVEKNLADFVEQSRQLPEPPVWPNAIKKEDEWEDRYFSMRYQGEDFLVQFIDIAALVVAHEKLGLKEISVWNNIWNALDNWINSMVQSVRPNIEHFSLLSKEIRQTTGKFELTTAGVAHPVIDLLESLSELDGDSAGKKLFRRVFRHEMVTGLADELKDKDSGQVKIPPSYRLKARLGKMAVESILIEYATAQARQHEKVRTFWKFMGMDTDRGFAFQAGENTYSIYMCNPEYPFYQIRADKNAAHTFPENNSDLGGGLFCSWKLYPNGNVLVRFDGFKDRQWLEKNFKKALEASASFLAPLSAESLLKEKKDSRLVFLKEASSHMLGIGSESDERAIEIDVRRLLDTVFGGLETLRENVVAAAASIFMPQPDVLQPVPIAQSQGQDGRHVVEMAFTDDTHFLNENDFTGRVLEKLKEHNENNDMVVWWFMAREGTLLEKCPQCPEYYDLNGLSIEVDFQAKQVWFLIGPEGSLEPENNGKIKVTTEHTLIIYDRAEVTDE